MTHHYTLQCALRKCVMYFAFKYEIINSNMNNLYNQGRYFNYKSGSIPRIYTVVITGWIRGRGNYAFNLKFRSRKHSLHHILLSLSSLHVSGNSHKCRVQCYFFFVFWKSFWILCMLSMIVKNLPAFIYCIYIYTTKW